MNYIIKKKNGELCHGGPWSPEKLKYGISTANIQAYRKRLAEIYGQAKGAVGSAYGQVNGAVNGYINKKRTQKNAEKYQRDGKLRTYNTMTGGKFKLHKNDPKTAEYMVNRIRLQNKDMREQREAYLRDRDKKKMEARVSAANAQARGKKLTNRIKGASSADKYQRDGMNRTAGQKIKWYEAAEPYRLMERKLKATSNADKYQRDGMNRTLDQKSRSRRNGMKAQIDGYNRTRNINAIGNATKYQTDGRNRTGLEKSKMTANGPKRKPGLRKDLSKVRNQNLRRDILNGNKTSSNSTASEFHGKQRSKLNINANGHRTKRIVGIKNQKLRDELLRSKKKKSGNRTAF